MHRYYSTLGTDPFTAWRKGEYFWQAVKTNNLAKPAWLGVTVASGGNTTTGNVFLTQTPEHFSYDADGNLTNDGRWSYTWDAENRLVEMTNNTGVGPLFGLAFVYDAKGRRIQKSVTTNGTSFAILNFLYDGWNPVALLNPQSSIIESFTWGNDLSGSMQGAGGVGGLLAVSYHGNSVTNSFVAFDGNGNVASLVNAADGTTVANYEYGPFGEVIRQTGPMAESNPFRFSTKYQDDESDLLYYGYRYYKPSTGTWVNRDPMLEKGGVNLYCFVGNDAVQDADDLGEMPIWMERFIQWAGYRFWRTFMIGVPHWQSVMDAWFYELPPSPVAYVGISDPRNADIAKNVGFIKSLNCWIANKSGSPVTIPAGVGLILNPNSFQWKYKFDRSFSPGQSAAYTPAIEFLGSYTANVTDLGSGDYLIEVWNTSGWTSGTRLPGWLSRFGIYGSIFYDHPRGAGPYTPSRGGNLDQKYTFVTHASPCATCVLP